MQSPVLYLITDRQATAGRELAEVVAGALAALPRGAGLVQLRDKDLGGRDLRALAERLREVTAAHGAALLVNSPDQERLDLALAVGADGVHLPEHGSAAMANIDLAAARAAGGPDWLIGVSTHSPQAALAAAQAGASLVVLGPVWTTPSKAAYGAPLGLEALRDAAAALAGTDTRLYALGGVTEPERARAARAAGAHGIAGIRAFMGAADPGQAAAALYQAIARSAGPGPRSIS